MNSLFKLHSCLYIDEPCVSLYPQSEGEAKTHAKVAKQYPKLGALMRHLLAKSGQLPSVLRTETDDKDSVSLSFDGLDSLTIVALYRFSDRDAISASFEVDDFLIASD